MRLTKAFTLIELLTVIAIIAILAAIIFPVFSKAKESAFRSSDISSMNALRSSLQLYKVDQGGYPPALLGYVTTYATGGGVVPASATRGFLYPKRVDSIRYFRPVNNKYGETETTTAVWPQPDGRAVGTAPIVDTNGDGRVTPADDTAGARQAYTYTDGPVCFGNIPCGNTNQQLQFYKLDGYDVAEKGKLPNRRYELRYSLFFTNFAIGAGAGYGQGSGQDDPRQLGYAEPPEDTLVTWNDYFREYDGTRVVKAKKDMVLFLGGAAKPFASNLIDEQTWRAMP